MTKVKTLQVVKKGMIYAVLVLFSMFFLFPFAFMFFKSVMGNLESAGSPYVRFLPEGAWHFSNYARVFDSSFLRYFRNTLIVIAFNIVGVPLAACFVAFGFARGKFKTKNFWFAVVLGTIMLPGVVTQVPVYIMFKKFGLTGTLAPLIIPNFFGGGALNIFLARQFIRGISKEIDEAARIDGASRLRCIFKITLPLIKNIVILMFIMSIGNIFKGDFGMIYPFIGDNALLYPTTDVIDTYVYRALRTFTNYGRTAAIGLYQSVMGFALVLFANWLARRHSPEAAVF